MLRDLHIRNLAVLEEAAIEFGPGFNVLSGETGAGKSIVVDSLALLLGARASSDLVRTGADALAVTGIFEPAGEGWREAMRAAGLEPGDDEVVIRREVSREGRSRAYVDDRPVTLKLLSELAPSLARIHGQRDEQALVESDLQRAWLDASGGERAAALLERTAAAFAEHRRLERRLERLSGDDRARRERVDFLRFQLAEIDDARPEAGEEDRLRSEREVLRHAEAIGEALAGTCELLFDDDEAAYERLSRALHLLEGIADWEPEAPGWSAELEELRIRLAELDRAVRHRAGEIEADPARLDAVEDRLATLERLFRKHGGSSAQVLERREELASELAELAGDEDTLRELEAATEGALEDYRKAAGELSAARRTWAKALARRTRAHLAELALQKARFEIELGRRPRAGSPLRVAGEAVDFSATGHDRVTYLFSPNPGEDLRPLAKVASGGELSRLYLAVQLAARGAASKARSPTLVFDEVDAGVGGAEAAGLGAKLRRLAAGGQVLAVTHLPQVASFADLHFKVTKAVRKGRTHTAIERLEEQERVAEVARMLAGAEVTELSLSHARELIVGAGA